MAAKPDPAAGWMCPIAEIVDFRLVWERSDPLGSIGVTPSRYLIAGSEQPRVRRAADVTSVAIGATVVAWSWWSYQRIDDVDAVAADLTGWISDWAAGTLAIIYAFGTLYAVGLFVAVLARWRTRGDALRDIALAVFATAVLTTILVRLVNGAWPMVLPELGLADPAPQFPVLRVALVTAILLAASPHLTLPMRRVGWTVIFLNSISAVALGFGLVHSAIGGVALGAIAAGGVLLVFGSPRGYPDFESIREALTAARLEVKDVRLARDQSWGVRRLVGHSEEHGRVEIKAYGRDASDLQFFARTWRYLWYRDTEPSLILTRMQSVEHEALVTMMAGRTAASVPDVLAAGLGGDGVAVLAVDRSGTGLTDVEPGEVTDDTLRAIWASVSAMHAASISHGRLNAAAISIGDDGHQIGDFGAGTIAAPESYRSVDIVELLFSTASMFGVERAVAAAQDGLGIDGLATVIPYIQPPAVSTRARRMATRPKALIKQLREEVADATGVEVEEPAQVRRVEGRNVVLTGLSLFAAYFLITQLSGIDFAGVWEQLQNASWSWILVGFAVGQLVYFPEATAMLSAVGYPIPLRPAVILQSAAKFVGLAVPGSAGRIGMTAAFLRKFGLSLTASLVQGSIDTLSGVGVEVVILVAALVFGDVSLGLGDGEAEWGLIVLAIIVAAVVAVLLVRWVQRLRDWIMPVVREAFAALGAVLRDPNRMLGLLISNFGSRFVLAISMWFILLSLGVSLSVWAVLSATVAAGLLAGIVPVPGGIGVSEAVLTAFLVMFGVDETAAFSAAVVYRTATFYVPAAAGFFSMRWLDTNGYI